MNSLISSTPLRTLTNPPGSAKEQRKLASKNTNKRVETPVNETEEDDIVCIDTNPEEFRAFIGVQATKDEKSNPNKRRNTFEKSYPMPQYPVRNKNESGKNDKRRKPLKRKHWRHKET